MVKSQYIENRLKLLKIDRESSFDGELYKNKTFEEEIANSILQKYREEEIEKYKEKFISPISTLHFSEIKRYTDTYKSKILESLKTLPKGILHHCHIDASVDAQFVIKNVINDNSIYLKFDPNSSIDKLDLASFYFFKNGPPKQSTSSEKDEGTEEWMKVKDVRNNYKYGVELFDKWLYDCFTIVPSTKEEIVYTENEIWKRFNRTFKSLRGIFSYVPFTKLYIEEMITRYSKKDIQQIEVRFPYYNPYDDKGDVKFVEMFGEVIKSVEDCKKKMNLINDDSFDVKFIISPTRFSSSKDINEAMEITIELYQKYPEYIAGFDMVGHEHESSLERHVEDLLNFRKKQKDRKVEIPFYFHAGETTDSGTSTDNNLFDAVLLESKRIGHAYSLSRHLSTLSPIIKEKNICLEISPISNQYLGLVKDMANHPIIIYLKNGLPVSVSSDDPSLFGYEGSSYDFYMLYMSFNSIDLWSLKQLCKNSILYGSFTSEQKKGEALKLWEKKWNQWIKSLIDNNPNEILTN